ncbi:hypothetical protein BJ912DRAFT_925123 [Pholiota molesta]|nr:hypothetical protein BJ912DRAFT_925123 [Pholiota molesta]
MPPRGKSSSAPSKAHPSKDKPPGKRGRPRKIRHSEDEDDNTPAVRHVSHKLVPKVLEVSDSDSEPNKIASKSKRFIEDEAEEEDEDEDEDDQLEPDDSMYPEQATPSRVMVQNPSTPRTPPLSTRRNARTFTERDSPDNPLASGFQFKSPTKRPKEDVYASPMVPSSKKGFPQSQQKKANPKALAIDEDLTFDDISDPDDISALDKPANATGDVYQEDLTSLTVKKLPATCEVANPTNQDSYLSNGGYYNSLPNLQLGTLLPLKDSPAVGLVMFTHWRKQIKGLKVKPALEAIIFTEDDNYVNPSRVSPLQLIGRSLGSFNQRFEVTVNHRDTALFLSPVMVVDSYLRSFNPKLQYSGHYLTGIYHSEEWARYGALLCMLAHQPLMKIQMWKDAVSFTTKAIGDPKREDFTGPGYTVPGLLNPASSPSKLSSSQSENGSKAKSNSRVYPPLAAIDPILVYNASGKNFEYSAETFNNLSSQFPIYDGENGAEWRVTNYAQWVLLLGVPENR